MLCLSSVPGGGTEILPMRCGQKKKEIQNDVFKRTAFEDEEVGEEWFGWATR